MNRKLKFRFWDTKNKTWLEDASTFYGERYFTVGNGEVIEVDSNVETGKTRWGSIENVIPQQFTGLLDCKGKEIYEGDIVKGNLYYNQLGDKAIWEIIFKKEEAGFFPKIINCKECGGMGWNASLKQRFEDSCVVGNIFENKELCEN